MKDIVLQIRNSICNYKHLAQYKNTALPAHRIRVYCREKTLQKTSSITYRAQLLKTNDVVSERIVKTFIVKYGIYANIFAENKCE